MSEIARLLIEQSRIAGQVRERSGALWGNAVSGIAQVPGQIMAAQQQRADRQQQQALAASRDARDTATAADEHQLRVAQLESMRQKQASDWAEKLRVSGADSSTVQREIDAQVGKLWTPEEATALKQTASTPEGATRVITRLAPVREAKPAEPFTLKNASGSESRFGGAGELLAEGDATPKPMTPGEQAQRYETERHNREAERISALTEGRTEAAQRETARHNRASESIDAKRATGDKLTKVEHKDPVTGRTVIEWLPQNELRGQTFQKGATGATETRLASAQAVNQTGNDIIAKLSDPAYAKSLGVTMGRASKLSDWIGNPPPEYSELAGAIESYALANMGVHGMRSAQGAEQIKKLLDQPHTPESLIAAIKGLNKFSEHFMANEGRPSDAQAEPSVPSGVPSYQDYLKSKKK